MGACCCPQITVQDITMKIFKPKERYVYSSYLSAGGHGKTYKFYDRHTDSLVTCKKTSPHKHKRTQREANFIKLFDSDNLPKFVDLKIEEEACYLYYKYIPGEDMFQYLFETDILLTQKDIKITFKKMIDCLIEIRNYGLIHLDVKFENFIFDKETDKVSLIDFEGAHPYIFNNNYMAVRTYVGTKSFTAPETWRNMYHKNTDIWSLGVCLWILLIDKYPFDSSNISKTSLNLINIINNRYKFPNDWHIEKMKEYDFEEDLKDLFSCLFKIKAHKRIDLDKLRKHKWLILNA